MSDEPGSDDGSAHDSDDDRLSISETQDLCNITYSRKGTIAAFNGYFEFLTAMFMGSTNRRRAGGRRSPWTPCAH